MNPFRSWQERKAELAEELESHLRMAAADRVEQGASPGDARREAMREFGNVPLVADVTRERWGWLRLEHSLQDLRYALRTLGRDRSFTIIAVLILALGIGANIVVFSVVNTILLRPLPFYQPQRLVWIAPPDTGHDLSGATYSADAYEDLRAMNRSYEDVTGYYAFSAPDNVKMTGRGEPKPLTTIPVIGNFFHVLGVQPMMGRTFTDEETRTGGSAVMLSYGFWKRELGGDRSLVGKALTLNGTPLTVIGVLPETFDFGAVFSPGAKVDAFTAQAMNDIRNSGNTLALMGRLKPGVTLAQSRTEATPLFLKFYWSKKYPSSNNQYKATPIFLKDYVSGALRRSLIVLWCAVGMILLIVCVNLSNLLLARTATRSKEFALRVALGAGRGRLIRQLLTESLVLSGAGAVLGLGFAYGATFWLAHQGSIALPLLSSVHVDGVVLAWTVLIAIVVGLLFGLAPGLKMSNTGDLQEVLKDSGPGTSSGRKHERLRTALVISEVALACVLVVGAGLLLRSFLQVLNIDLGFQPSHAAAIKLDLSTNQDMFSANPVVAEAAIEKWGATLQGLLHQVSAIPGVEAAGVSDNLPLERNRNWDGPEAKGRPYRAGENPGAFVYMISPGYLGAMGMRVHGRDFGWQDTPKNERVIIVNRHAAESLWPGQDAVGRMATLQGKDVRVIGVIDDVRTSTLEGKTRGQMYLPTTQGWDTSDMQLVVRSKVAVETLSPSVMRALREINPGQPLVPLRPIQSIVDHAVSPRQFFAVLVAIFAGLGLLLASLGIYGVISYSVTRQTQEIGIRMALGATRERVQMGVISKTLRMALIGLAVGTVASFLVARAISSMLFGTEPTDPMTFAGMIVLLIVVAFVAGYLPARRASRINPMVALRSN
jgi:predicted permease